MGLLKIALYLIIAIAVFSLISTYIINVNAPEVASLFVQFATSFFKGASFNNTIVSNGANFSYPGNWFALSPSVMNGIPILSQNNSISRGIANELTNSSVYIIMPNSYMPNLLGDIPSIVSGALSKNFSLSKIGGLLKNVSMVAVANFNMPSNLSNGTQLDQINGYLSSFRISTVNSSPINLSGYPGFLVTDRNVSIPQIANLSFAYVKVAIAVTGRTICMVFGLVSENNSVNLVSNAFKRVTDSLTCRVN